MMDCIIKTKWPTSKIRDLCDVSRGSSPRPIADKRYFDGGKIPWIKIADATKSGKYLFETKEYVNDYGASFSKVLPAGTIIVAASGTLGYTQILGVSGCAHDGWLILTNLKKLVKDYAYYVLKQMQQHFYNSAYGAAIQNINTEILRETRIPYPPLHIQCKIATILSNYDDLIENNLRRIKILEEMAQNLYREWFVNFRFPGHEQTRFVDSPMGRIPEGWEVVKIGGLIKVRKGKNITKKTIVKGAIPVIAGGKSPAYYHNVPNTVPPVITISASGANAGYVCLYHEAIWASDCSVIDWDVTKYVYYYYLKLSERHMEVTNLQRGSAQPHVYPKDLMDLETINVPIRVLDSFNDEIKPIYNMIRLLALKNINLRQTRDLLLPDLISGELDVSGLDITLPEVVKA